MSLTQVSVLLLAEVPPLSKAEVELFGIVWVVVAAPDSLARVIPVAEPHEAVIVPEIGMVRFLVLYYNIHLG